MTISPTRARTLAHTVRGTAGGAVGGRDRQRSPVLIRVKDGLWRVADAHGAILGHIERQADARGDRFLARRITTAARTIELGAFWRIDEATDCFRS